MVGRRMTRPSGRSRKGCVACQGPSPRYHPTIRSFAATRRRDPPPKPRPVMQLRVPHLCLSGRRIALLALFCAGGSLPAMTALGSEMDDWGPSGSIEVRAERARPSGHVAWEFELAWTSRADGARRFEIRSPRVHALDGRPATLAEARPYAMTVEALDRMTPAWWVSPEAVFLGLDEPDSLRSPAAVLAALEQDSPVDPGTRASVLALLESPALSTMARSRPRELWSLWVEDWLGIDFAAAQTFEREGVATYRGSSRLPTRETWQVESLLSGTPRARLQVTRTYEVVREDQALPPDFERSGEVQALLRPDSRRPASVGESSAASWIQENGESREEFEQTLYTFAWPAEYDAPR